MHMSIKLCCAEENQEYKIIKVCGCCRNKLSTLGFSPNTIVKVLHHKKNGPINISIRDFSICLRHNEAECVEVEII